MLGVLFLLLVGRQINLGPEHELVADYPEEVVHREAAELLVARRGEQAI